MSPCGRRIWCSPFSSFTSFFDILRALVPDACCMSPYQYLAALRASCRTPAPAHLKIFTLATASTWGLPLPPKSLCNDLLLANQASNQMSPSLNTLPRLAALSILLWSFISVMILHSILYHLVYWFLCLLPFLAPHSHCTLRFIRLRTLSVLLAAFTPSS